MSRMITIELPDMITVNGMAGAPDELRCNNTAKWSPEFCLTAIIHGVSQRKGDTWSVSKKDVTKTRKVHEAIDNGDWNVRANTGQTAAKFDEAIKRLNADQLIAKLSPELLSALAAKIAADNAK